MGGAGRESGGVAGRRLPEITKVMFTVTTTVEITEQQVCDLLITAFECNDDVSAWVERAEHRPYKRVREPDNDSRLRCAGGREELELPVQIWELDEVKPHTLDLEAIQMGLTIMASEVPHHFRDILQDNVDATTADVFLQCCLFKEVRY